jgi:hypothetical protein
MTSTTLSTTSYSTTTLPVWRSGLKAAAVASVATSAYAAVAHAAGVSFEISGEMIPVLGFAQLTFMLSLVGLGIAKACGRSQNARQLFVRVTAALTVLSLVPDALADATTSTRLALMVSHLIAAAIVIPALAGRLGDSVDSRTA